MRQPRLARASGEPASGWSSSSAPRRATAPRRRRRADAEAHVAAPVPADADEIEPARRARERALRSRAVRRQRHVAERDRREPRRGDRGQRERGDGGDDGEERLHGGVHGSAQGDGHRPPPQEIRPHPDRILTAVGLPHLRGFLLTVVVVALALASGAPASTGPHRVLVASLDDDINPVSQHYLQAAGEAGRARRLRRARRRARHAGRPRHARCAAIVKSFLASPVPVIVYVSPSGLERRLRRRRDRPGGRRPRDGAADEHRLLDADHDERHRLLQGPPPQDRQRRRRLHRRARARARPQRRRRPSRWCATPPTSAPARRPRRTSSTSSRRRCPPCSTRSTARVTKPKGLTLHTAGASVDTVQMSFWQRTLDTLIDPNIIALMLSLGVVGHPRRALEPGPRAARHGRRDLADRRPLRPAGAAGLGGRRADAAALARPLRDRRARHLARRADARRRGHVRDRRADALRPGRARLPGLALDRARDRGDARAPARRRALADRQGAPQSRRGRRRPARRRGGRGAPRRPRRRQRRALARASRATAGRCRRATTSPSRRSEKTSSWS